MFFPFPVIVCKGLSVNEQTIDYLIGQVVNDRSNSFHINKIFVFISRLQ